MKFSKRSAQYVAACLVGLGAVVMLAVGLPRMMASLRPEPEPPQIVPPVALVQGTPDAVRIAESSRRQIGLTVSRVERAPPQTTLRLTGWLFIDPARLVHIHARFPGEIISLGTADTDVGARPLRVGDTVAKGEVLAVMWCREMGEKKSDLVDAVSQLRLDERVLHRLRSLEGGAVAQRLIEEAERKVEADRIALSRAERTLRSWRLSDEEIARAKQEAAQLQATVDSPATPSDNVAAWAESTIKSPISGTLLEQNVVPGDIVDTSGDLFKLADLSRLGVMANVYEEDLRLIEQLPPEQRRWRIQVKADPKSAQLEGRFELISSLVDPTQHTTTIVGWINNPDGKLRVGQFISATIELPRPDEEVTIPEQAALEEGPRCYVFVASDDHASEARRRRVPLRRFERGLAYLSATPTEEERREGVEPLRPGERVVASGAVELAGALAVLRVQTAELESSTR